MSSGPSWTPWRHRFTAGNRIRLLIAGGSFPSWEHNLGTGMACQVHEDGAVSAHDPRRAMCCVRA
jgi:predicted acyl esterase